MGTESGEHNEWLTSAAISKVHTDVAGEVSPGGGRALEALGP